MALPGLADTIRIATFHAELTRKGPGILLRDLGRSDDPQTGDVRRILAAANPDIVLLTKVDTDAEARSLAALQSAFGYPYGLSFMPNSNRFIGSRRAAWAPFSGAGGMVLLSRVPISSARHFNEVLWKDLPFADLPVNADGTPYYSKAELRALPLVSQGLWQVETGGLTLVAFQNTTPVFDGPEDRNGRRARDQLRLVQSILDDLQGSFVALGNSNLDPNAGDGDRDAMRAMLERADLTDPEPRSADGGLNTAFWVKAGPMRVSYVLPSRDLRVTAAGVFWPEQGPLRDAAEQASRHRLVWVDITR